MQKIYLDHNATTPVDPIVLKKMLPYYKDVFGNASSQHSFGQEAMKGVDWAREEVAKLFGCKFKEVIFSSGATESNNLILRGLLMAFRYAKKENWNKKFHIITSAIEHPAVLEPCRELEKEGLAELTVIGVDKMGLVEVDEVVKAIKENTILVSIMYVNNEIGTIQPIKEIGVAIKKINEERAKKNSKFGNFDKVYFHTDAVQAAHYCDMKVQNLNVDLITISGHKIYGPKGVGAIYIKEGTPLRAVTFGGHQEYNIRPGTYNVAQIVGLGAAVEMINDKKENEKINKQIGELRDYLVENLLKKIPETIVNGDMAKRVPANANLSFKNAEGESMLLMLDLEGIAASTGSACASGSLAPSHVLLALGLSPEVCHASLRFSLGKFTTKKEIDKVIEVLPVIISRLRKMSPIK
ncbi:MAG: cysteine desulfurase family protein [Patescibacteria group bacterium]|nr:cysteine desulfurase family protein [Patescibacteria group bacterium]